MRRSLNLIGLILIFINVIPTEAKMLKLPPYEPTYRLSIGGLLNHVSGHNRVSEYEDIADNPYIEPDIEVYPLPHRFHLYGYFAGDKDYFLDTGYAYRDVLLSRFISLSFVHNLESINYPDEDVSSTMTYEQRSFSDQYSLDSRKTHFKLRLKTPDYPLHFFIRYFNYYHRGESQQRFLIGQFGDMKKVITSRSYSKNTTEFEAGTNGHFGPLEVEYIHREKRFNPGGETVLYDNYPDYYSGSTLLRPSDRYQHNVLPDIKGHSNTLKLHTSYTGQIVASATASRDMTKNQFSGVKRRSISSSATFQYMPSHRVSLFLRLHYIDIEESNADITILRGLSNQLTYDVRKSIDLKKKTAHFITRIRPFKGLTLIPSYSIESTKRSDTEGWMLTRGDTLKNTFSIRGLINPVRKLKLRAEYRHVHSKNPLYNFIPEDRDRASLYLNYYHSPYIQFTASYSYIYDKRGVTEYYDALKDAFYTGKDRRGKQHNLLTTLTVTTLDDLCLSLSFGYYKREEQSTLAFKKFKTGSFTFDNPYMEHSVPYSDRAIIYMLNITRQVTPKLQISLDLSTTYSKGSFRTTTSILSGIEDFSRLKSRDIRAELGSEYRIARDTTIEFDLLYESYRDSINTDLSGRLYRGMLKLTRTL